MRLLVPIVRFLLLALTVAIFVVGINNLHIPTINQITPSINIIQFPSFLIGPLITLITLVAITVFLITRSVKIIPQGNEAIVERLGRYQRTLKPGLNFISPFFDKLIVATRREQILDIEPQTAITRDNVTLEVDAIVYWKVLDVQKAYYAIEDLDEAVKNLTITTLRSEIGSLELRETVSSRNRINQALLHELDEATESWGISVIRVEVANITLSERLIEALEEERAAESRRKAAISEADGMVESIRRLQHAFQRGGSGGKEVMRYLVAQRYIDCCYKIGESKNSKVLFMDPKVLTDSLSELVGSDIDNSKDESDEESYSGS